MKRRFSLIIASLAFAFSLAVVIAAPAQFEPRFNPMAAQDDDSPVAMNVIVPHEAVPPGTTFPIAVAIVMQPKWHISSPDDTAGYPSELSVGGADGVAIGKPRWPEAHEMMAAGMTIVGYSDTIHVYVPVTVAPDAAAGERSLTVTLVYQTCDDVKCLIPTQAEQTVTFAVRDDATLGALDPEVFGGYESDGAAPAPDPEGDAAPDDGAPGPVTSAGGPVKFSFFGLFEFSIGGESASGLVLILLIAALGGFLLNLTPCVLPVIPIKIMGLAQSAGTPGRAFILGLWMCAGIIAFWLALSVMIVSLTAFDNINSLFQRPWFGIGVGLFILVMGIGMLGAFTVQLPQKVYMINPKHDSPVGSFGFGVMTAILSTPCTAPFMGSAAAWATQTATDVPGKLRVLAIFTAIGVGMAIPYLVLSRSPRLVDKIPRTGPASELLKQVMGGLLIAVAFFFGGAGVRGLVTEYPWLGKVLHWWLVAIAVGLTSLWLIVRTFSITPALGRRITMTVIAFLLTAGIGWWTMTLTRLEQGPKWDAFEFATMETILGDQGIVLVEFTADW